MAPGRRASLTGVVLAGGLAAVLQAQEPVFRAAVETVRVDVAVTRGAAAVDGLTASQFEVHDNGEPQAIDQVLREEVPLKLLLVLDTSGSLAGEGLHALVDAARSLVDSLRPRDSVGLVTFSQSIQVAVPPTTTHADVTASLDGLRASGPTAWRDALFAGLQLLGDPSDARPVVLLFSDGDDTASWIEPPAIVEAVRRAGVVLHVVGFARGPATLRNPHTDKVGILGQSRSLERAAEAGGGRRWSAASPADLRRLFATALDELRRRYLVVYSRRGPATPGWHDVRVRVKGVRAEVRARPGYFVAP